MRMPGELGRTEKVIGIIDLGSNSVRLLLVRVHADGSTTILNQVKHMVRLGEGGFTHSRLQEETMARTIAVLRGLAEMCAVYGTTEIIAIATAAVRDAVNGPEFIRRVQEKTGIDFTAYRAAKRRASSTSAFPAGWSRAKASGCSSTSAAAAPSSSWATRSPMRTSIRSSSAACA